MRRLLPFFLFLLTSVAFCSAAVYRVEQVPNVQKADALRYTSNPDHILSEQAVRAIDCACDSLRKASRAQVAVVAIEDIEGDDVFTFAHSLFSSWGVGGEQSDNGLGILLVTARREIRFVTGYGLEGVLTDALCKRIQQRYMVEHLSAGDYSTGMVEGVAAVARLLSDEELQFEDEELTDEELLFFFLAMFGFVTFLIAVAIYTAWRSRKCPSCGKCRVSKVSSSVVSSTRQYDIMEHYYRCSECGFTRHNREKVFKSTGGPYIGGGFGGGSFGGGGGSFGGGFGGGSFGGGGAGSRF